jgi:hypothetical protein
VRAPACDIPTELRYIFTVALTRYIASGCVGFGNADHGPARSSPFSGPANQAYQLSAGYLRQVRSDATRSAAEQVIPRLHSATAQVGQAYWIYRRMTGYAADAAAASHA